MRLIAGLWAVTLTLVCAPLLIGAQPAAAAAATHSITVSGYAFSPAALTITAGDTVTWTNRDQAPHDVTTTSSPVAIHGSTMQKGQSWSYTFTTPGTYAYICSIHPDMKATLTVVAAAAAAPARTDVAPGATVVTTHPASRSSARPAAVAAQRRSATAAPRTTSATAPAGTSSSAVTGGPAAAGPGSTSRPLRPLLIIAGGIAAVATLALLMLASQPDDAG
jgi:plastocyanin